MMYQVWFSENEVKAVQRLIAGVSPLSLVEKQDQDKFISAALNRIKLAVPDTVHEKLAAIVEANKEPVDDRPDFHVFFGQTVYWLSSSGGKIGSRQEIANMHPIHARNCCEWLYKNPKTITQIYKNAPDLEYHRAMIDYVLDSPLFKALKRRSFAKS